MDGICNKDCFNCPYDDCINDSMDLEDYREIRERDLDMLRTPEQKRRAAAQKAYYIAHKDDKAAYRKVYYEKRKDYYKDYRRAYRAANREMLKAKEASYQRRRRAELGKKQRVIAIARKAVGVKQVALADALHITRQNMWKLENSYIKADIPAVLQKIAELAHMSVDELLERTKIERRLWEMITTIRYTYREKDGTARFLLNGQKVGGEIAERLAMLEDQEDERLKDFLETHEREMFEGRQIVLPCKEGERFHDEDRVYEAKYWTVILTAYQDGKRNAENKVRVFSLEEVKALVRQGRRNRGADERGDGGFGSSGEYADG